MNFFCPYCTREITPDTDQCPQCGYVYGPDTINLLTTLSNKTPEDHPQERRKHLRINKKFKVTYPTPKAFVKHYLSDIGTGGLFISTGDPLNRGVQFDLKILISEPGEELELLCEVVWVREDNQLTPKGTLSPGMGVKFVDPSKETLEKIVSILRRSAI